MSEWWTYRPSDFLMFAPGTYWRLFELHNLAMWPAQVLIALALLGWAAWGWRRGEPAWRTGFAALALAWAAVAWGFLLLRYAPVNWAAQAFAFGFAGQALGLAVVAASGRVATTPPGPRRRIGLALCAWALAGHPWLALWAGRPWTQAELFGLAPDPTVIATLGLLLCTEARGATRWLRCALWALSLTWCAVSAATLWTLGSAQGWVMLVAGLAAGLAAAFAAATGHAINRTRSAPAR